MQINKFIKDIGDIDNIRTWMYTPDINEALQFTSFNAAFQFYNRQSVREPLRTTDGMPNRPLTAFDVIFESL